VNWSQASDLVVGEAYSKEWVPAGQNIETASWLIAEQKVPVDGRTDAGKFLETVYDQSANACSSATHDEIENLRIEGARVAVGRTMCGHRIGTDYGAFTDRMVLVDNGFAYIVTSELRIAPMIVDGILSFGNADDPKARAAKQAFMDRELQSRSLVRDHIHIVGN
jgi:hypothetical protein